MNDKCAKHISKDARNFILKCLERDKDKRSSVEELLDHSWLKAQGGNEESSLSKDEREGILTNIKRYS